LARDWGIAAAVSAAGYGEAVTGVILTVSEDEDNCGAAALLRDIAGNPLRPITVNSAWLTPTV